MEKKEKLENCLFQKIVEKYNFFLSDVEVNITKNPSRNSVYFDPEITVTTQLVPNEYWDMKTDIYSVIKEETNLTPVLPDASIKRLRCSRTLRAGSLLLASHSSKHFEPPMTTLVERTARFP